MASSTPAKRKRSPRKQKQPDLTFAVEVVTPEQALAWLNDHNTLNRKIREATVEAYARDMLEGRWEMTAEPLKFDRDGNLLDGQHRLHATARSGVSVTFPVARNVTAEAQRVMDTGTKRQTHDQLRLAGYSNTAMISAAGRLGWRADHGLLAPTHNKVKVTNSEVLNWVDSHSDIAEFAAMATRVRNTFDGGSIGAFLYTIWRTHHIARSAADDFWEGVITGADLAAGDPRLALRAKLTKRPTAKDTESTRRAAWAVQFVAEAWNAYRAGEDLSRIHPADATAEPEFR